VENSNNRHGFINYVMPQQEALIETISTESVYKNILCWEHAQHYRICCVQESI